MWKMIGKIVSFAAMVGFLVKIGYAFGAYGVILTVCTIWCFSVFVAIGMGDIDDDDNDRHAG